MKKGPRILVVEGDENTCDLIRKLLEREAYETSAASDGQEALRSVASSAPDLILLNVVMPRLGGFETCRALKGNPTTARIPVIFVTGQTNPPAMIRGYDLDADHYVTKPFHPDILLAQVRRSLRAAGEGVKKSSSRRTKPPKVFISYKWEGDAQDDWVVNLATDLKSAGMNVFLDRWDIRLGDSFTDYMTSKLGQADVMLFVMTKASVRAVEARSKRGGALRFEMQLAQSRRLAGENLRIIPIYREGSRTAAQLRDHRYADFRDDSKYKNVLQVLVMDLLGGGPALQRVKRRNS